MLNYLLYFTNRLIASYPYIATIKADAALSKIPEAHKYQIKSPKGLTALKNNHARFVQTAKTLLPKSKLYKGVNIISSIDRNLQDAAEAFFIEMY